MKCGWKAQGYTILEVMIFLAVSSALLVSALYLIGGQQQRTEFNQSARDIQSQVEDIMNNVASGFYARPTNFNCTANNTGPVITAGATPIGGNSDCIFIGRAIHFGIPASSGHDFNVYNLIGNRQIGVPPAQHNVTTLSEARPVVLPGSAENRTLKYQLSVDKMYLDDTVLGRCAISTVVFLTSFGESATDANDTAAGTVDIRPLSGACNPLLIAPNDSVATVTGQIDTNGGVPAQNLMITPDHGVVVCFGSGSSGEHANLRIGGNGRGASTDLVIGNGPCP